MRILFATVAAGLLLSGCYAETEGRYRRGGPGYGYYQGAPRPAYDYARAYPSYRGERREEEHRWREHERHEHEEHEHDDD